MLLVDVSNNNGLQGGFAAIDDPRVGAVYAKATEGLGFHDPDWPEFRARAAHRGKPIGAYYFLHPNLDGAAQARYLLAYAKPHPGDLEPVVDTETLAAGSYAQAAATTLACLNELGRHGFRPLWYASSSFVQQLVAVEPSLKGYRCWYADYASRLWTIPGVRGVLWQNTDAFVVGRGRFRVDGDRLLARDLNEIRIPRAAKVKHPQPPARPKPKPRPKPKAQPPVQGEPKNEKPFTTPVKPAVRKPAAKKQPPKKG